RGVTLVELMIAMVISLLVLLGVATVYSSSKRSYKVQEEMARLQENARYAFASMAGDITEAGFAGCNPKLQNLLNTNQGALFDFMAGIDGWEYTATSTAPGQSYTITSLANTGSTSDWTSYDWGNGAGTDLAAELDGNVLRGNDVLVIKKNILRDDIGLQQTPITAAAIPTGNATGIPQCSIVVVTDCQRGVVFQKGNNASASSLTRATGACSPGNSNPSNPWPFEITDQFRAMEAKSYAYYVGPGASGEPALFRADYGAGSIVIEELVEGVENMQVLYGEDLTPTDTDYRPTRYVTADNITHPDNVMSVRVSLLVRTPQELNRPQASRTLRLLGVDAATGVDVTTMNDRRVRKVFTSTFFLRNKGLYRERP
ncbi:MAG TPA: hypothetical protein EYP40_04910, partial [Chromatiales bacterium]|nr:hypothetical protein [Chromatiales bacterium]